jgi:hypothetical protein
MFSGKGKLVNIFDFVDLPIWVVMAQLCHCSMKASRDNMEAYRDGWVPVECY